LPSGDTQTRELFLARDPYGIKPHYYTRTKDGFVFASQVKGLLASGLVATEREPAGLVGFYLWGSVPEPWTLFHDVFALPAGHWLRVRVGMPAAPVSWYDIRAHWQREGCKATVQELQERVRQAVTDSAGATWSPMLHRGRGVGREQSLRNDGIQPMGLNSRTARFASDAEPNC